MKTLEKLLEKLEYKMIQAKESEPCSRKCSGRFTFGDCIVTFYASSGEKDVEVWDSKNDKNLDNIAQWLVDNSLDFDDIEVEEPEDEWNINGFRSEIDYLTYKYG